MSTDDGMVDDKPGGEGEAAEGQKDAGAHDNAPDSVLREPELPPPASVPVPQPPPAPKVWPPAEIIDVSPTKGPTIGGTKMTLVGKSLHRESIVRIGGTLARTIDAIDGVQLRVEVPSCKQPGPVNVSVQNPGAELSVAEAAFRYEALPPPKITSVAPNRGATAGGTELSISGSGFVSDTKVIIDGAESDSVVFVDGNTLEVKTAPGKAGKMIDVMVENPDGERDISRRCFMYDERYD